MSRILSQVKMSIDKAMLKSKFRGSLLGSLLGDCLGAPYEGESVSSGEKIIIQRYFDQLESPELRGPYRQYTDDTAMTKSVAQSLIESPEISYPHMARLFVKEYFLQPGRGYGQNVVEVFSKLRKNKFEDIFRPAKEQFGGSGSYGNGGAMRVAPLALYFHNDTNLLVEAVRKATEITHTNPLGVQGAILQALAVQQALTCEPTQPLNYLQFCEELTAKLKKIEMENDDGMGLDDSHPYGDKMSVVQYFLEMKNHNELDEEVVQNLGNSIAAHDSVPTAIYCFLKAVKNDLETVKTDNLFRRTIQYAVTLGGDTDTIASMAGAIAGAYVGEEGINPTMAKQCEFYTQMINLADELYNVSVKE